MSMYLEEKKQLRKDNPPNPAVRKPVTQSFLILQDLYFEHLLPSERSWQYEERFWGGFSQAPGCVGGTIIWGGLVKGMCHANADSSAREHVTKIIKRLYALGDAEPDYYGGHYADVSAKALEQICPRVKSLKQVFPNG